MKLAELNIFSKYTIQCHDNPDADTIASGYALYEYFSSLNKDVRLVYSGSNKISKPNLILMLDKLNIPIEYVLPENTSLTSDDELLITVDCQYGAGNVTKLSAKNVAVIDHHQPEIEASELMHIIPDIGGCSTIIWNMLKECGYSASCSKNASTALYYGLLTDTNNFVEAKNPLDLDAKDELDFDSSLIDIFLNSNISLQELEIAGIAMLRYVLDENNHFVVIKTQPCDPNVLGIISDFLLQVDKIYTCVVFNEVSGGFKLSVRSCIREVNAGELAGFLTKDIGSGGGHYKKAGGFISRKLYEDKVGNANTEGYFINRMTEYFNYYELIYADSYKVNENELKIYQKVNVPVGYVKASDVLPVESPITVRTMEGDMDLVISDDLYIMIGIKGEVYPINEDKFKATYSVLDEKYNYDRYVIDNDYIPTMISRADGNKYKLEGYAGVCISTGESRIYAKELSKGSKVFTSWDKNRYMLGKPGDFLAVRMDDLHDMYIVDKTVFEKTYRLV